MDTRTFSRPEVMLNACPEDGGSLFRRYADHGVVFECPLCGHRAEPTRDATPAFSGSLVA